MSKTFAIALNHLILKLQLYFEIRVFVTTNTRKYYFDNFSTSVPIKLPKVLVLIRVKTLEKHFHNLKRN